MIYDDFNDTNKIGDSTVVDLLTKEKIKLARDLSHIDRRLLEIHEQLEKLNDSSVYIKPAQVISRPAKRPESFATSMSSEQFDKLHIAFLDNVEFIWYNDKFPNIKLQHYQLLVQKNCILWPVSYSSTRDEVIIHECTKSNQHMSFVFDTTKMYKLQLIEDLWNEESNKYFQSRRYVDMILVENPVKEFVGFFVNPVDIDKIRIQ